jgi:hypothetical protein
MLRPQSEGERWAFRATTHVCETNDFNDETRGMGNYAAIEQW